MKLAAPRIVPRVGMTEEIVHEIDVVYVRYAQVTPIRRRRFGVFTARLPTVQNELAVLGLMYEIAP